ncbi:MAG: MarR family transcriptional regulator [Bacteroidia bacterium]|nr:MarR family transcriptional regulator [Bacteroidia bacterium]
MSKKQSFENCLYHSANALSRVVTRIAEEEFKSTALSPSAAFILLEVNISDGILIGDLSKKLQLSPSTLTRLVEGLEKKGFLTREQKGKFILVHSTKKSKSLQNKIKTCWKNFEDKCTLLLGQKFKSKLVKRMNEAVINL